MIDADRVAKRFRLGTVVAVAQVHGGLLNWMWRVDTDGGSFAIKELNHARDWPWDPEAVFRLERAAFAAGLPLPEPVGVDAEVAVHRWVDGDRLPEEPVPEAFAREIGGFLARLHALDLPAPDVGPPEPLPSRPEWDELATRAEAAGADWAHELAKTIPTLVTVADLVAGWSTRDDTRALTHRDVSQKNLLAVDGHPVVLDWEAAGVMPIAHELGATAVNLASDGGFTRFEPAVFRSVLDGYGELPEPGPHWFSAWFSSWTWFLRWNVRRCLDGETRDEVLRRGLVEIPRSFAMLDELTDLTRSP